MQNLVNVNHHWDCCIICKRTGRVTADLYTLLLPVSCHPVILSGDSHANTLLRLDIDLY
jgi:hypothetical protein